MYKFAALLATLACAVSAAPKPGYVNGYSGYDTYNGNIGYAVPVATSYSNRYDGSGYGLNGYGSNGYYGNGYGSGYGNGAYGAYRGNVIGYGSGNGYYDAGYGTGYNKW